MDFFDSDETILNKVHDSDFVGFSGTTPQLSHMIKNVQINKISKS